MRTFFVLLGWVFSLVLTAAPRTESTFKDPITGKSGRFTIGLGAQSAPKNQGLLIFFHGSGNTSGYAGNFDQLAAVGATFDLIPLAIQAPNQAITWPEGPNAPNNQHVAYVRSLLEREIFLKYPGVDRGRVFFVGYSAGSTFLSGDFLPVAIQEYKGGAVLLCGGGGPVQSTPAIFRKLTRSEAQSFRLYLYIQKNDFLAAQTAQGVAYWKSREAEVQFINPDGGGHCAFDFQAQLTQGIKSLIQK